MEPRGTVYKANVCLNNKLAELSIYSMLLYIEFPPIWTIKGDNYVSNGPFKSCCKVEISRLSFMCSGCSYDTHCRSGNGASLQSYWEILKCELDGVKNHIFLWPQSQSRQSGSLPLLSLSKPLSATQQQQQWGLITFNATVISQV